MALALRGYVFRDGLRNECAIALQAASPGQFESELAPAEQMAIARLFESAKVASKTLLVKSVLALPPESV